MYEEALRESSTELTDLLLAVSVTVTDLLLLFIMSQKFIHVYVYKNTSYYSRLRRYGQGKVSVLFPVRGNEVFFRDKR